MNKFSNALGLDVGAKRIGVARVGSIARLPEPLGVLSNDEDFDRKLAEIIAEHGIDLIVVGMPRNMSGEKTAQSAEAEEFAANHLTSLAIKVLFQDETLSSVRADRLIKEGRYPADMQDALAACIILEDFVGDNS